MSTVAFEYRAYGSGGELVRGIAQAASRQDAFRQLQAKGLTPVVLRTAREGRSGTKKIAAKDLAHFTYQLSVLLNANVPLAEGLMNIAEQEREGPLKAIVEDVARRVSSGEGVATALAAHQGAFGEVFVESVRASERSGSLATILEHLADMLERAQETTRQVRGALMYPASVAGVLTLASVFLVGVIVPKFGEMFSKRGASLPILTRIVMEVGLSVRGFWWAYLAALVAIAFGVRWLWVTPRGQMLLDRAAHRVPYIERIVRGLGISRFARVLGIGLSSGLGLIEALTLAGKASGRPLLIQDTEQMAIAIRSGGRLGDCLRECDYMPLFTKRMLAAGEQSGEMPRMCGIVSRHYERECQHLTKDLSGVLEPVLIVAIAGVVLVVALSIFLPMWDMAKLVNS